MASKDEIPRLHVEGADDCHALIQLLARHNIELDKKTGPVIVEPAGGYADVLKLISPAVKRSIERSVGFVIDTDTIESNRWTAVAERLRLLGVECPDTIPAVGFVGESKETKTRVGVWLMPDCTAPTGILEDLLRTLVPENDTLVNFAQSSTETALEHGAKYAEADRIKSVIHCWLAWQEVPGESYGHAIRRKYFDHAGPVADAFVRWFRTTFNISSPIQSV